MDAYLNGNDALPENKMFKTKVISILKEIRSAMQNFNMLKSINEENDEVKFLLTEKYFPPDYNGTSGAFLCLYESGRLQNEDLRCR